MTREDIIRMARTALRLSVNDESLPSFDAEKTILNEYEFLYWFAKEVAAAEREACASICDENDNGRHANYASLCAAEIRNRGNK